jgi:acetyl-CoA carboxylase biotin carboxyl carrier protein
LAKKKDNPKSKPVSGSPMDMGLLQQITRLMTENDLNTVDVRDGDKRVILKRGAMIAPSGSSGFVPQYAPVAPHPGLPSGAPTTPGSEESNLISIKSPMVGTFYSSSSPDAKPFVAVGSQVEEETDVCIIEAMKVFNNIKAECRGTIAKILVENGATVEFGQVLFMVTPS